MIKVSCHSNSESYFPTFLLRKGSAHIQISLLWTLLYLEHYLNKTASLSQYISREENPLKVT